MYDKKKLREKNLKTRKRLFENDSIVDVSKKIVEKITNKSWFLSAEHILIFYPKAQEIDLRKLLETKGKQFYLPRCNNGTLEICPYCIEDELCKNKYGILEPICKPITDLTKLDIIFMPALGADLEGNRIGYGGGYYDRFFGIEKNIRAKKVVVLPADLICEKINCESFDIRFDELITD